MLSFQRCILYEVSVDLLFVDFQHGCLVKFGRTSTFRFMDPVQDSSLNRNLSQSHNFGSGSVYDRSVFRYVYFYFSNDHFGSLDIYNITNHRMVTLRIKTYSLLRDFFSTLL